MWKKKRGIATSQQFPVRVQHNPAICVTQTHPSVIPIPGTLSVDCFLSRSLMPSIKIVSSSGWIDLPNNSRPDSKFVVLKTEKHMLSGKASLQFGNLPGSLPPNFFSDRMESIKVAIPYPLRIWILWPAGVTSIEISATTSEARFC